MGRPRWPDSHNSLSEIPGTVQDDVHGAMELVVYSHMLRSERYA